MWSVEGLELRKCTSLDTGKYTHWTTKISLFWWPFCASYATYKLSCYPKSWVTTDQKPAIVKLFSPQCELQSARPGKTKLFGEMPGACIAYWFSHQHFKSKMQKSVQSTQRSQREHQENHGNGDRRRATNVSVRYLTKDRLAFLRDKRAPSVRPPP